MTLWNRAYSLAEPNALQASSAAGQLGVMFTALGPEFIDAELRAQPQTSDGNTSVSGTRAIDTRRDDREHRCNHDHRKKHQTLRRTSAIGAPYRAHNQHRRESTHSLHVTRSSHSALARRHPRFGGSFDQHGHDDDGRAGARLSDLPKVVSAGRFGPARSGSPQLMFLALGRTQVEQAGRNQFQNLLRALVL